MKKKTLQTLLKFLIFIPDIYLYVDEMSIVASYILYVLKK